jgi:hypothetical protein
MADRPNTPGSADAGAAILATSRRELGVHEDPDGSNRGPRVDQYKATCPWLDPHAPWFWCAAYDNWVQIHTWGRCLSRSPSVADQAAAARAHALTVPLSQARPGDAICLGNDHITRLAAPIAPGSRTFQGIGGNQGNAVRVSTYPLSRATTVISAAKVAAYLHATPSPPQPPRRPRFVVTRDEHGREITIATVGTVRQATARAARALRAGAAKVTVRRRWSRPA